MVEIALFSREWSCERSVPKQSAKTTKNSMNGPTDDDAPLDDWQPESLVGYGQPPLFPEDEKSPEHQ